MSKVLVAYFSASGTTKKAAEKLAKAAGADLYEIKPAVAYTKEDLNWMNKDSRSSKEMQDKSSRPALADTKADIANYEVVFIGFPIWWYSCPMAILSFIEENDLSDKKIVLFCTHGTGGLASSVEDITAVLPASCDVEENVIGVYRNDVDSAQSDIQSWLEKIGYSKVENEIMEHTTDDSEQKIIMTIGEQDFEIVLYDR